MTPRFHAQDFAHYRPDIKHRPAPAIEALVPQWKRWAPALVVLEQAHARPSQHAVATFKQGQNRGLILGTCLALGFRVVEPEPSVWKALIGVSADKSSSVRRAAFLFPALASHLAGPRGGERDGVAEAALLAWFGRTHHRCTGTVLGIDPGADGAAFCLFADTARSLGL